MLKDDKEITDAKVIEEIPSVQSETAVEPEPEKLSPQASAFQTNGFGGSTSNYQTLFTFSYTGEKNPGEMGVAKRYQINHTMLRARSWQAFLDSDMFQAIIKKFTRWVIGAGLKIQAQPVMEILEAEGISLNEKAFIKMSEARFRLYCDSKTASFSGQMTLHEAASEAYKNAITGGDVLVIMRVENGRLNNELIDGDHIFTPLMGTRDMQSALNRGNKIKRGVELDARGRHIAYFIRNTENKFERVPARDEQGNLVSFLVYGMKYRLDNDRGIPIMSAGLEVIKKLDRYKEAAVGAAEERAKIPYFIEHDLGGTGESPFNAKMGSSVNLNQIPGGADSIQAGQKAADLIAATTAKQAYNLPPGATIKSPESKMEAEYTPFFMTNFQVFCAAAEIPVEVALSKYDSSFSASRAALKEFEHTLKTDRKGFALNFYDRIYRRWILLEDARGKIEAPGLFEAFRDKDEITLEAYTKTRFIGANVPHIDPLKEVKAEREKLGALGKDLPLTTVAQSTEALGEGDYDSNIVVFSEEVKEKEKLMPTPEPIEPEGNGNSDGVIDLIESDGNIVIVAEENKNLR